MFRITLILLLFHSTVWSQQFDIQGVVKSKKAPVSYANVWLKGTEIGGLTDENGAFNINAPAGEYKLQIELTGFKPKTIPLNLTQNISSLEIELVEDVLGLEQVVVSANRDAQSRKEASVIVSVTTAKTLESVESVSLSEGLNFQPGLRMETNCQNCGFSQVRINGLDGAYSQILINSKPIFSALNGVYGLDQIPANVIERIEVVRGGGSALFGSNAIAGTINVITKDPIEDSYSAGGSLRLIEGENTDQSYTANASLVSDNLKSGISVYGLLRRREAHDINGDEFTEITELEGQSIGLSTYYKPNLRSRLSTEFLYTKEYRRGGNKLDLLPYESDVTEEIESNLLTANLAYHHYSKSNRTKFEVYASTQLSDNDNYYGGIEIGPEGYGYSKDKTWVLGTQFKHQITNLGTITAGYEWKYDDMQDVKPVANAFVDQLLRVHGTYLQHEYQYNKVTLTTGLRADYHNLSSETINWNPRVNVLYAFNDQWQWRSSYAKGFRAPQFFTEDLHAVLAAGELSVVRFDPNLVSETSHSFLSSIEFTKSTNQSDFRLTLEGFFTRLRDPFVLESIEGSTSFIKSNANAAKTYGTNLEVKLAPNEQWLYQFGLTYQQSLYDERILWSDERPEETATRTFFRSPNLYGNFVIGYAPNTQWQTNLSGVYTGRMYAQHLAGAIAQDELVKTPDFFELNLRSSYTFELNKQHDLQLSAGVKNIFNAYQNDLDSGADRDGAFVYGPSLPRTVFIGLKFGHDL